MADFFGLHFLSKSTYYILQRLNLIPEIEDWWCWMRKELHKEFEGLDIILGGGGQCDSPGFSAKNLRYFLVKISTGYTVNIEVLDKRPVHGGPSVPSVFFRINHVFVNNFLYLNNLY